MSVGMMSASGVGSTDEVLKAADASAATVQDADVKQVRKSLLNDGRLAPVLCNLRGVGNAGAHESGSEAWMRRIDDLIGKLNFRLSQLAGPACPRD